MSAIVAVEDVSKTSRDGTAFIFSTHDPKVMAHATAVVRIADGRVAAREVPSEAAAAGGR
jgi:putative ABC transport system ATP-binding protein